MIAREIPPVSSALIRFLEDESEGVTAAKLIDSVIEQGYVAEDVVRAVRQMLDSGELGLTSEMRIRLQRQLA